jgi:5-methylcytosine-specific restriction endonuclease McrA
VYRTPLTKAIRKCFKYRQWRSDVFERDDYTCQFCGVRGSVVLNADHIKPFALILNENSIATFEQSQACEELWNINNGRTLCEPCHKSVGTHGKPVHKQI